MIITGYVKDSTTGMGIPYASIRLVNSAGQYLGSGVAADNTGAFMLNTTAAINGTFLEFTSTGYKGGTASYTDYTENNIFKLTRLIGTLPPVVVTAPPKPAEENKKWLWWAAAAAAAYALRKQIF